MVSWTDRKERQVVVKGAGGGGKCSVVRLEVPSSAETNKYFSIVFICHVDQGPVKPALAIENCSGNPGNMYVNIGREYKIPPGKALVGAFQREYNTCTYYSFTGNGRIMIKFDKPGTYRVRFYAGYS